jgi:uncharacterized protein (TIGR03435 family)
VTAAAITQGATAGVSTLTLINGALKLMAWTKVKIAAVTIVGVLLVTGTAMITIDEVQRHERENFEWQSLNGKNSDWLKQLPPLLKIARTKLPSGQQTLGMSDYVGNHSAVNLKEVGLGFTAKRLLEEAYYGRDSRTLILAQLPGGKYDFIVTVPDDAQKKLQAEIERKFGVAGRFETIETNVLLLTVTHPDAVGLRLSGNEAGYASGDLGHLYSTNVPLSELARMLEDRFEIPVIDGTASTNHFDFTLVWEENGKRVNNRYPDYPDFTALKRALLDQLGLELVPTNMPVEMLVVDKVR